MTNPFFFFCLLCLFLAFKPFFFLCPFFFLPLPANSLTFKTANDMGNKRLEERASSLRTAKVQQSCYNALAAFGSGGSQC
ncbi:hypothetical protein FPQ18DRAFT_328223 [Pyronema domesticum]|nr:hypothetical protein FPQ18DRAFT_328223 [Pyronema domesticum]